MRVVLPSEATVLDFQISAIHTHFVATMTDSSSRLVAKLWSYCQVLRDDGLSYQDYLEQLTFLLFLKMSDERARLFGENESVPEGYRWRDLADPQMDGARLEDHYRETLRRLGEAGGGGGVLFLRYDKKKRKRAAHP